MQNTIHIRWSQSNYVPYKVRCQVEDNVLIHVCDASYQKCISRAKGIVDRTCEETNDGKTSVKCSVGTIGEIDIRADTTSSSQSRQCYISKCKLEYVFATLTQGDTLCMRYEGLPLYMPGQQKHTKPNSMICTKGLLYLIFCMPDRYE
jgi:hypothetical protein